MINYYIQEIRFGLFLLKMNSKLVQLLFNHFIFMFSRYLIIIKMNNMHNYNHQLRFFQKCIVFLRSNLKQNSTKEKIDLGLVFMDKNQTRVKSIQKNKFHSKQIQNQYKKLGFIQEYQQIKFRQKIILRSIEQRCIKLKSCILKSINTRKIPEDQTDDIENNYQNDKNLIDENNLYCDYFFVNIQKIDEFTSIYRCLFCEDFHVCKISYFQYLVQVHLHQLQENFLQ
ncbi:unnamed protein product [Paramecium sonneborni]|uniref:Transmembrane protein n=1 Tax=Paramecium sonneborni TaxID=65129 RepID=A0A8S1K089_9CILI|nr:unnamed protein product [Paramecium sonneborni]